MSEVYVFYCDRKEIGDIVEKDENFRRIGDGILKTCYYYLDFIEPLTDKNKMEKIQALLNTHSNDDYSSIMKNLGVEDHYHKDLLDGKYRPFDLSFLLKEMNLDDSTIFIKQIEKEAYLVVKYQYQKDLNEEKAEKVLSAILKNLEKDENIKNKIYEFDFYIFFHDTHIGRPGQSTSDLIFNESARVNFKEKVEQIFFGADYKSGDSKKEIKIREIVSFKHVAHGKTLSILKEINKICNPDVIKKNFNFSGIRLQKFHRSFLPLLINIEGIIELEEIGLNVDEYKKDGEVEIVEKDGIRRNINIKDNFKDYLEKYWKDKKIAEEFDALKNSLKGHDSDAKGKELENKFSTLENCSDYREFEKTLNTLITFLEEIKQ